MGRIVLRLASQIQFGKYKGKITSQIVKLDPNYLKWVHNNLKYVNLLQDTKTALGLGKKPLINN